MSDIVGQAGSPVRWLGEEEYRSAALPERALAWADSQVGVKERGWNRGTEVEAYQEEAGMGTGGGYAWCACFVYWCLRKSGGKLSSLPGRGQCASVRRWRDWAQGAGWIEPVPKRGRLFFWLDSGGTGHIGWCLGPARFGVFRTIEGNTDSGLGSREGDGVYKRLRSIEELKRHQSFGFISLERVFYDK